MDYTVKNLEKTSNIEGDAIVSKIHNMQWLKNTSHSSNEKMKAISYKQIQDQDENNKGEDKVLLKENVNACLVDEPEYHSIDTCKKYSSNDTMPIINENICNQDINTDISSFSNANKCSASLNGEQEDMSITVENFVTAKLQTSCIDKDQSYQPNTLPFKNNIEDIQDAICSNLSKSQPTNQDTKELNLIKHCDDNNNDSKFTTQCLSKINRYKERIIDKITDAKSSNISVEVKSRGVHIKKTINIPKICIKNKNDTTLIRYDEKVSHSNDFKKSIPNLSKSPSDVDKNGRLNQFKNRNTITKNIDCTRKQEFVKHNISTNEIEKKTNFNVKSSLVKTNFGTQSNKTIDSACHTNKNTSKDKVLQKPQQTVSKQFVPKLKRQEYFKKSISMFNHAVDKNKTFEKTEKITHVSKKLDLSLSELQKKSEKTVNDKNFQSDQKKDHNINFKKNNMFVTQYKNLKFLKSINFPKNTEYERNSLYTYIDPRDRERTDNVEHVVIKREYTNKFSKSNIKSKELHVNNLECCTKSQNEINHVQLLNVDKIDTLTINDKRNIDSIKTDTHFVGNKESSNFNIHTKQESIMSEQCHEKTEIINKSKIDINQQNIDIKNEVDNEINPFKQSSNLSSNNKCTMESLTNVIHKHVLKLENIQDTGVKQLRNNYSTSNDTSLGNVVQKNVTIVNSQESTPNMHFNTQQAITRARNQMKKMSWGTNRNKFCDQYFSVSDVIPLSQIPNTFNVASYECNMQTLSDSNIPAISALEMNSHKENWNLLNRYIPNKQRRSVMALSDFSNHFITSNQTNRWNTTIQDGFHVEHPYNAMQSTVMHVDSGISDFNDFNNVHVTNSLPHPVYSASPYIQQTWNTQLQYSISVVYNSPCVSCTMIPNTINQLNNSNDGSIRGSYVQNDYVKDTYRDLNNCAVQARSIADNIPIRFNQYYKKYQDNYGTICSTAAQCINPVSYPNSQQGMNFTPATSINQSNTCYLPNQRHHQARNYSTQMSRNSNGQTQDLICNNNSNDSEDSPPIISPIEFITDKTSLNKSNKFATYIFKSEFKMRPNMGSPVIKI